MRLLICVVLITSVWWATGSRVLFFAPVGSKSHKNVFNPLAYGLLDQGHDVTFLSFASDEKFLEKGGREFVLDGTELGKASGNMPNFFNLRRSGGTIGKFKQLTGLITVINNTASLVYDSNITRKAMKEKFDLVVLSIVFHDVFLPIVKHWDCPYAFISPSGMFLGTISYFGGSQEYATYPGIFSSFPPRMSFFQRLTNALGGEFSSIVLGYVGVQNGLKYAKRAGILHAPYDEMRKNASLALLNTDFSINNMKTFPLNVIEVGGMHCRPSAPLPSDLEEFVSGAGDDGFIIFGLGSAIQVSDMPLEFQKMFLNAFARLKQRVLWKWETTGFDKIPENVKLVKWLPQQDLLGHPKIKAFLSHGGLLSIQEAVYHSVPLIGLPLGSDQDLNVAKAVRDGYALSLDWNNISEEIIYNTIQEIVTNNRFQERADYYSTLMRDQKETPLERAVFWIEYVIRHRGAPHLQSPAKDLNRLQRNLVDVIAFLAFIALLVIVISAYVTKKVVSYIVSKVCSCGKKTDTASAKKKKN